MHHGFCLGLAMAAAAAVAVVAGQPAPRGDRSMRNCTLTIDVRRAADYAAGHLSCSLNFPR